jgi:hypothetical protein
MVLLDSLHLSEVCPNTLTTRASRVRVRSPSWMQDSGCRYHTPRIGNTMSGTDDPTQGGVSRCNEDRQDTPAYFDKMSACRESLLIFVAKLLVSSL